jgi:uncharacterized protein YqeY
MTIGEQLAEDLKKAMKSHDDLTKDVIRLMRAALQNATIEKGEDLSELKVVMRYLPEQLGAADVMALARAIAEEVGAAGPGDKGKVMGKLMPQLKGKADGTMVNTVVGEMLDSLAAS